ncbi:MAG: toll/interleukin-1 receptor domain-containing protein [Terrimicrobiaceae bacterium]
MAKPKNFISYSSKDRVQAETIHESLEAVGDVWRDQTRLETDWSREIALALVKSDLLCLLWSEDAASSKWVKHEWLTARALEKQIIACLVPKPGPTRAAP